MAINFPNSPSNGDIFGNYTYDSSIPGWRKTPENSASLPAGTIVQWPGATAPANWLICDGAAISRTEYASLFAAVGVQYGAGNGTTTFNLPNLKGRVAVGFDALQSEFDVLGEVGGAKTHTLTASEMPSHTHTFSGTTSSNGSHSHTSSSGTGFITDLGAGTVLNTASGGNYGFRNNGSSTASAGDHTHTYSGTTSSSGSGSSHNNLQPYIVLNYIIKTSAGITSGDSELATRVGVVENQNNLTPMSYNYVINGAFDIWQRGTSFTGAVTQYCADRWKIGRTSNVSGYTLSRSTDTPLGFKYSAKLQRNSGDTQINRLDFTTNFETAGIDLAGKTITISFYAKKGENFSGTELAVYTASSSVNPESVTYNSGGAYNSGNANLEGSTNSVAFTSSWARYSVQTTIASTANALQIRFGWNPSGTGGADDSVYITGVQLEEGSYATAFRRNAPSIQAELAACQRYYYRVIGLGTQSSFGSGMVNTTTQGLVYIPFPVTMRTAPSATLDTTGVAANYGIYSAPLNGALNAVPTSNTAYASANGGTVSWTVASGAVAGQSVILTGRVSGAYIGFTAEL
jgi:microcystin-dependent protein